MISAFTVVLELLLVWTMLESVRDKKEGEALVASPLEGVVSAWLRRVSVWVRPVWVGFRLPAGV